ncbi:MAG TPA: histidine kinase dimerization/phospho-acceptor domain-containing protein [Streptosporangiaceae bacterium]|nr:histidine kinase dimerization/phospho-acceptor domain-containing protein [Streptosporangiaceae bacterium]
MLSATLNEMLDRIEESVERERRFVDRASHELRTPLAIQRMELDVALAGPPAVDELRAALHSVSQENAHLARLTQDLLVQSRARAGALPIRRVEASLPELVPTPAAGTAPGPGASTSPSPQRRPRSGSIRSGSGKPSTTWWTTPSATPRQAARSM